MKLKKVTEKGTVVHFTEDCTTLYLDREESRDLLDHEGEFTHSPCPEVVHLELTSECNLNCNYCYVDKNQEKELSTQRWKEVIEELSDVGVFQLTFGGGEPFERDDVFELAEYVRRQPMNLAVTTNGTLLERDERLELFDQINISHHEERSNIEKGLSTASEYTDVGINYLLRRDTMRYLPEVTSLSSRYDAELLILPYKPVNQDWEQMIDPRTVMRIAKELSEHGLKIAVDMFTKGRCTGGENFIDIDPSGEVYRCSFMRESLGNILEESFSEIWNRMELQACHYLSSFMKEGEIEYGFPTS